MIFNAACIKDQVRIVPLVAMTLVSMVPAVAADTPSNVVKAFYTACNEGGYSKAEKLVTKDSLERMASLGIAGSLSAYCDDLTEKGTLKKVETFGEKVRGEGVVVRLRFVYENGSEDEGREALIRRNGIWKIELLQTGITTSGSR